MPVEIRELVIKVTVNQPSQGQQQAASPLTGAKADDDKEAIISQCVDEILGIIDNKKER
jgi:hypothetical protein